MRILPLLLICAAPLALPACTSSNAQGEADAPATVPLTIRSDNGTHKFTAEVARTPEEQEKGLMFRNALPADRGMVFPFPQPKMASFWMKNTAIPLDMIFIRTDGSIARIATNTVPYSTQPVSAGEPVIAVLELAGGTSDTLGIAEGDTVAWPH